MKMLRTTVKAAAIVPVKTVFHVASIRKKKKNNFGTEALNEDNLVCKAIQLIKKRYKDQIGIMCDVALDPYTSHGHDGIFVNNKIDNDQTIKILIN